MSRFLLILADDPLSDLAGAAFELFEAEEEASGPPLLEAAESLALRAERTGRRFEAVVVPLADARRLSFEVRPKAEIVGSGGPA